MSSLAIRAVGIGKSYRIGANTTSRRGYKTLQEDVLKFLRNPFRARTASNTFWALQDVSFDVNHGEVLGIIGRNGAGKSTLLKILSRITKPTTGYADVYGRIGSLLEVGTGFHPELTGRENIFLNGAILGMRRGEIQRRFDEIVEFAEIEQFLETPVKRYSSGMYMRLAFAVAAHLDPEVLVVDEVLAVGDAKFQEKCLGKMREVASGGRTVLFVSHNMAAVQQLCSRVIVLSRGQIVFSGTTHEGINAYIHTSASGDEELRNRKDRIGSGEIKVVSIQLKDQSGVATDTIAPFQPVEFRFQFENPGRFQDPRLRFSLLIRDKQDQPIFLQHNKLARQTFQSLPEFGSFVCRIPSLPLRPNTYKITYSLMLDDMSYIDYIEGAALLNVGETTVEGFVELPPQNFGPLLVAADWAVEGE